MSGITACRPKAPVAESVHSVKNYTQADRLVTRPVIGGCWMGAFSFAPTWVPILPAKLAGVRSAVAALALIGAALTSPSYAQAPALGTTAGFGVLAGSTITNTGASVIGTGANLANLGVFPGLAITGLATFPILGPGTVNGVIYSGGPIAGQAQVDLTTAYNNLASRPTTVNLTGQNLGGLTLIPGVYNFNSSAQLTGTLTLNGLGNPNSVFIFNIGSTLTTASASTVNLINSAQGGDVFWRVGSSATLGTTTAFAGDILALTSITLNTGAGITCGAAWARNGAVTLDTNTITLCNLIAGGGGAVIGPAGAPLVASLLPASADSSQRAVANAIDTFVNNGGTLPLAFVNLYNLSPSALASAFSQLQGEAGTGAAQAGTQAMNSFLSLLTNPFNNSRGAAPEIPLPARPALITKAPIYKAQAQAEAGSDPRRWSIWAAAYGGHNITSGDTLAGSHDRSARTFGYATGLDYRLTPNTIVGFALAGGSTDFGLSGGFGSGHSDMFQAAVYSTTVINAAYVSAVLAYAFHRVSTDRYVTVAGTDHLTADFSANDVGGRIEGGYRFAIPGVLDSSGFGVTPYAALQVQAYRTPSYSEVAASGSSTFALAYDARTTTTTRSELGSRVDKSYAFDSGNVITLFGRAAWAHDWYSDPSVTASFLSLPGSSFTEFGATPVHDSLLASAGAQIGFGNGVSLAAWFDGEFAAHSQTYAGTARLRYTW
jgi:outer membrane autotransporter protein